MFFCTSDGRVGKMKSGDGCNCVVEVSWRLSWTSVKIQGDRCITGVCMFLSNTILKLGLKTVI